MRCTLRADGVPVGTAELTVRVEGTERRTWTFGEGPLDALPVLWAMQGRELELVDEWGALVPVSTIRVVSLGFRSARVHVVFDDAASGILARHVVPPLEERGREGW